MDSPTRESNIFVHDVVIVGAGPCGLAVAARLCEHTPSAIFTDEEHQRYHWIRKHGARMSIKNRKNGQVSQAAPRLGRVRFVRRSTAARASTGLPCAAAGALVAPARGVRAASRVRALVAAEGASVAALLFAAALELRNTSL